MATLYDILRAVTEKFADDPQYADFLREHATVVAKHEFGIDTESQIWLCAHDADGVHTLDYYADYLAHTRKAGIAPVSEDAVERYLNAGGYVVYSCGHYIRDG